MDSLVHQWLLSGNRFFSLVVKSKYVASENIFICVQFAWLLFHSGLALQMARIK